MKLSTKNPSEKSKVKVVTKLNPMKKTNDGLKQTLLFQAKKLEVDIIIVPKSIIPPKELPIQITPNLIRQKYLFYFRKLILAELEDPQMNNICQKVVDFTLTQKEKYLIDGNSQISYQSLIRYTKFIFYKLIIPQNSMNWDIFYNPETSQDFFDDRNSKYIKYWLKVSFYQLKKTRRQKQSKDDFIIDESQDESAAFSSTAFTDLDNDLLYQLKVDPKTQRWKYSILRIFGGSGIGKSSLIKAIAKEMHIEVIETNEFTEKKVFEELFQSQKITASKTFFKQQKSPSQQDTAKGKQTSQATVQDVFSINEKSNCKKLILHRSELPKYFPSLLVDQKVPMIWISDQETQIQKANDLIDYFEFVKHTNLETAILVFFIQTIEENFRSLTSDFTKHINQNLSYQKLQDIDKHNKFFSSFDIKIEEELQNIKLKINENNLMTSLNFSEVIELSFKFQGNIRLILNWIEFYHKDKLLRFRLLQQLRQISPNITKDQIYERTIYQMQNTRNPLQQQLLDSVEINFNDDQDLSSYCAELIQQQDNDVNPNQCKRYQDAQEIIYVREKIIKKYFQPIVFKSLRKTDHFTVNMLFKIIYMIVNGPRIILKRRFQNEDQEKSIRENKLD